MPLSGFKEMGHEQVIFNQSKATGLISIIAIHDTTLGPALGGCRMFPYPTNDDAIRDALRLSRQMTYKAAAAGLNLGGGKALIIGDPKKDKSEALFRSFGRAVESLCGRYITAEDVGTDVNDMEYIFMETASVTGVDKSHGGSGDPAPFTALGVLQGMRAAVEAVFDGDGLQGRRVAIQGLGHVGFLLTKMLAEEGAQIVACDIDEEKTKLAVTENPDVKIVGVDEIFDVDMDVFAPCAMGSPIDDGTIKRLKAKVICGSANNQLDRDELGDELAAKGVLYAPDYVVNAGGLINVSVELEGYNRERALRLTRNIYYNTLKILRLARKEGIPTNEAADRLAEERIKSVARVRSAFSSFKRSATPAHTPFSR